MIGKGFYGRDLIFKAKLPSSQYNKNYCVVRTARPPLKIHFITDKKAKKPRDRVEIAFRKFDLDNDGYLSWEEFTQVKIF